MTSPSPSSSATSWESLTSRVFAPPVAATPVGKSGDPGGVANVLTPAQGEDRKSSFVVSSGSGDEVAVFFMALGEGKEVCGGCIGSDNSKFCTFPCAPGGNTCGRYAKHSRKAGVAHPAFFISASRPGVAFLQPSLSEPPNGGFAPSVVRALSGTRSQEDWIGIFTALSDVSTLTESEQQDIVARFSRVVGVAPTPMALRKKSAIEDLAQIVAENPGGEQFNMAADDEWDESLLMEEDAPLEEMKGKWNGLVKVTQRQRRDISDLESNVRGLLEEVDDKVVRVAAVVGSRKKVNAPELTVWASIGAHSDLFDSQKFEMQEMKERIEFDVIDLQDKFTEVNDVLNGKVFPVVAHLTTRVEQIQLGAPRPQESQLDTRDWQRLTNAQARMDDELRDMEQRIRAQGSSNDTEALRAELRNMQTVQDRVVDAIQALRVSTRNESAQQPSSDDIQLIKEAIGRMQDEMSELRLENRRLHAAINSDSFSFGGHFFHTEETYDTFVTAHLPSGYYGYCLDFISIMECYEDANRTSSDGLKNTYTVAKAGYEDVQEARVDHSFGCTFPAIFGAPQEVSNPSKKMALFTTKNVWHDHENNSGLKKDIDIFMSGFQASIESEIYLELGQGTTASLFFVAMFQHTYTFWQRYSAWITKMIQEKMSHVGTETEAHLASVWSLICWMTYAMFIEMSKRRKAGTGNKKVGHSVDKKKKCVKILKGALGAHKFMKELMDAEFEGHPIFAATMDEYLLKNKASQISHDALAARFKKCEDATKSAQAAADKALQMSRKGAPANPK
jgi:hypothetical protein